MAASITHDQTAETKLAAGKWLSFRAAVPEITRIMGLMTLGLWLAGPQFMGAVVTHDFFWYLELVHDYLAQTRSGAVAPLLGQSEFLWNGYSHARQWLLIMLVWMLDVVTGARFSPRALLSVIGSEAVALTPVMAYFALVLLRSHNRWVSAALAALYATGPGVLAASHYDAAFASMLTLPLLPLAIVLTIRMLERPGVGSILGWGTVLSAILMANPVNWFWLVVLLGFT